MGRGTPCERRMQGNRPVFFFPPFSAGEPKTPERVHLRRREKAGGVAGVGWYCRLDGLAQPRSTMRHREVGE